AFQSLHPSLVKLIALETGDPGDERNMIITPTALVTNLKPAANIAVGNRIGIRRLNIIMIIITMIDHELEVGLQQTVVGEVFTRPICFGNEVTPGHDDVRMLG